MTAPQHDLRPWQSELVRLRGQALLPRPRCPGRNGTPFLPPSLSREAPGEGARHQAQPQRPEPLWQSALAVLGTILLCIGLIVVAGLAER